MNTTNMQLLELLETVASRAVWDSVELCIKREPTGQYSFRFWLDRNEKLGFDYVTSYGRTPEEAAREILKQVEGRDPNLMREKKIAELRKQIQQLQAVIVGLPPYRPNRELAQVNIPAAKVTVDI